MITTEYGSDFSNREYKSSAFTAYYSVPENAVDLYKALSGVENITPQDIEYQTLQGVIFMARKNDMAFTAQRKVLVLGEHQSTINQNMPLRNAIYYGRTMEKLIPPKDIYKKKLIQIPTPEFYLFYNGKEPQPAEKILKLSDAYLDKMYMPMLQLAVKMININLSVGHPILEKCRSLYEYSYFIQTIRDYIDDGQTRDGAIKGAMEHCVQKRIMVDFIREHGSEVRNMLFTEFNMEDALEVYGEERYEDGVQEGIQRGMQQEAFRGIASSIRLCRKFGVSREETLQIIMSEFDLKQDAAEKYMEQCWI